MRPRVGAMAQKTWAYRSRVAAASLLIAVGLFAFLDRLTRPGFVAATNATTMSVLGAVLVTAGAVCLALPFERKRWRWRLAPGVFAIAALLAAILFGDVAAAPAAVVGLTAVVLIILAYLGFVGRTGVALAFAPVLLVVLLIARQSDQESLSLALPLVAVPVASAIAELIAALSARSDRANARGDQRMLQLARLEDVLRHFRRPGSIVQGAHQVAAAAREIFDVDRSTVVLRDSRGKLIPVTIGPFSRREPAPDVAQIVADTIAGDEPRLVPTGTNGTMLVLPLPAAEAPAGAVLVYPVVTDDPEFTLDLARLFGVQVGIAIEHLFVIDELARATTRDELTGIGNRRHADALLRSLQHGDALILLDIDGFKQVNDTLGHTAGDQVLRDLSSHLRDCLRDSDTSARLGGDEFLVVARRASADPLVVAQRVLTGWAERVSDSATGGELSTGAASTTLSAGVALHVGGEATQATFEHADRALYQAKANGKNQSQLWEQPADEDAST